MMAMKRRITSFDFFTHLTLGGGVLLVVFGGVRMGLQYLEEPGATLLNPLNLGSLALGLALLLFGLAVSISRNASTPP
jgi:hypothetical protein